MATERLGRADGHSEKGLNETLRLLCKWRSVLLQNTLTKSEGTTVGGGPLSGLKFLSQSSEGCHIAKLLGTYEQPLHPFIEEAISEEYEYVVNIGSAEGYYAVGMARKMEKTIVHTFDIDENARHACSHLAAKNNVSERIAISGHFDHKDFGSYASTKSLVICDIEGGEQSLLDPVKAPALKNLDLIVESHECLIPGITDRLMKIFSDSHEILKIDDDGTRDLSQAPAWINKLSHLDQLLCVWEWRTGPTPWLVMRSRARS